MKCHFCSKPLATEPWLGLPARSWYWDHEADDPRTILTSKTADLAPNTTFFCSETCCLEHEDL